MSRLRIDSTDSKTIHQLPYLNAAPSGGPPRRGVLDVEVFQATGLGELDALIVTGDLQFRAKRGANDWEPGPLLGEVLAEELTRLCERGELPPTSRVGVVLTGDLYCGSKVHRRGETGDVRSVWESFAQRFMAVVGVAGNHDTFGEPHEQSAFRRYAGRYLLDLDIVKLAGLTIGGLSGIVGDPGRSNRRDEDEYLAGVDVLIGHEPMIDVLVLHESPGLPERGLRGNERVADLLRRGAVPLVACGHTHWRRPLVDLGSSTQVLNADARCVVLISPN